MLESELMPSRYQARSSCPIAQEAAKFLNEEWLARQGDPKYAPTPKPLYQNEEQYKAARGDRRPPAAMHNGSGPKFASGYQKVMHSQRLPKHPGNSHGPPIDKRTQLALKQ